MDRELKRNIKEFYVFTIEKMLRISDNDFITIEETFDNIQKSSDRILFGELDKNNPKHIKLAKNAFLNRTYALNDYELDGNTIKPIKYEPLELIFETNGKIVVENDLREFMPDNTEDFDINATKGIIQTMKHYHKQGMLHGFVGNSCPGLYFSEKHGEILIGVDCIYDENGNWTDEDDLPDDSYKRITSVCTDLWWYSIIDLDKFKEINPNMKEKDFEIVEIPAGTWKLTHKYGISEKGYHENLPYATLTLINKK